MNPVRDYVVGIEHEDYKNTYLFTGRATWFIYGND